MSGGKKGAVQSSYLCLHVFALHDRRALKSVTCGRCRRNIGAFAASVMKCTKCRAKIHQRCLHPRDLVQPKDGPPAPYGSSIGAGIRVAPPSPATPTSGGTWGDEGGSSSDDGAGAGAGGSRGKRGGRKRTKKDKKSSPLRQQIMRKRAGGPTGSPETGARGAAGGGPGGSTPPPPPQATPPSRRSYEPVVDDDSPFSATTVSTEGTSTPSPPRARSGHRHSERDARMLRKAQSFAGPERAGEQMLKRADSMAPETRRMYLGELMGTLADDKWPDRDMANPARARQFKIKARPRSKLAGEVHDALKPGGSLLVSTPGRGQLSGDRGAGQPRFQRRVSLPEPAELRRVLAQGAAAAPSTSKSAGTPPRVPIPASGAGGGITGLDAAVDGPLPASRALPGGRLAAGSADRRARLRHTSSAPAASMFSGRLEDIIQSERNLRSDVNTSWPIKARRFRPAHRPSPLRTESTQSIEEASVEGTDSDSRHTDSDENLVYGASEAAGAEGTQLGAALGAPMIGGLTVDTAYGKRRISSRRGSAPSVVEAARKAWRAISSYSDEEERFPDPDFAARMARRAHKVVRTPSSPLSQDATAAVLSSLSGTEEEAEEG